MMPPAVFAFHATDHNTTGRADIHAHVLLRFVSPGAYSDFQAKFESEGTLPHVYGESVAFTEPVLTQNNSNTFQGVDKKKITQ